MKFTQSDSFFVEQHFAERRHSAKDTAVESNASYVGQLSKSEMSTLDSFIRVIDFAKYDTAYKDDGLQDGSTFRFFIRNDSLSKVINIYGDSAPVELLKLGQWIAEVKSKAKLHRVDSMIKFERANDRLLPSINVDIKKLTPSVVSSRADPRLDGVYVGLEEMCWMSKGKKQCYSDPSQPKLRWFHLTSISIKGDSAYAGQSPITIYKHDTGWSASDGGFYSYRGTISKRDGAGIINMNIVKCDYCGLEAAKKYRNAFPNFPWAKRYRYKVVKDGLYINGYLFKKTAEPPW